VITAGRKQIGHLRGCHRNWSCWPLLLVFVKPIFVRRAAIPHRFECLTVAVRGTCRLINKQMDVMSTLKTVLALALLGGTFLSKGMSPSQAVEPGKKDIKGVTLGMTLEELRQVVTCDLKVEPVFGPVAGAAPPNWSGGPLASCMDERGHRIGPWKFFFTGYTEPPRIKEIYYVFQPRHPLEAQAEDISEQYGKPIVPCFVGLDYCWQLDADTTLTLGSDVAFGTIDALLLLKSKKLQQMEKEGYRNWQDKTSPKPKF
jgi:hypothetical protein